MDERSASTPAGWRRRTFDIGGRVIAPAFWALGVRRLDYMSVTHGDVDHIGGAASVFRDFKPFEVWEGVPVPPHAPTRALRALADGAGTRLADAAAGRSRELRGGRSRRASPAAAGVGAPARAERRLGGARDSLRRRVVRLHRRHRQGSGADDRLIVRACARSAF